MTTDTLGVYHKDSGELIAFPFEDNEQGLDEVIELLGLLHIDLDTVKVDEYWPGRIDINMERTS